METGNQKAKAALRQKIRKTLKNLSPEKRGADSRKLCARLEKQPFFQNAAAILFFAPLPDEVDLWPLLEKFLAAGKICALPFFDSASQSYSARRVQNLAAEISTGKFGVLEPAPGCPEIPAEKFDLILVPGVAFDLRGNRLGRGRGFFDRLLAEVRGVKCGIAFDGQIVEKIPMAAHDVQMDFILTPARCVETGK